MNYERMEHITQSEEEMWAYTRYMIAQCDRTAEINFAIDKTSKTIAQNLLAEGSTPEFIQKNTGLDKETIRQLT